MLGETIAVATIQVPLVKRKLNFGVLSGLVEGVQIASPPGHYGVLAELIDTIKG